MAIRSRVKKNIGLAGIADVRARKTFLEVHFLEEDETLDVSLNGWERENGRYNIVLKRGNDEIKYISPIGRPEPYLVKFNEFGNRPNDVPEPKRKGGVDKPSRHGGTYFQPEYWATSVKLEVVEAGIYKGLNLPYEIPYIFVQDPNSGATMLEGTEGQNKKTMEFLRLAGMNLDEEDIPFQTNVLPWLEDRLQTADTYFTATLNDRGFIDHLAPLPAFVDVSALLGENGKKKPARRKAPSKAKAK